MEPKEFEEVNIYMGKGQPEYKPLPAHRTKRGEVICCFSLTEAERAKLQETGEIWLSILTFEKPMQPIFLTVDKKDVL